MSEIVIDQGGVRKSTVIDTSVTVNNSPHDSEFRLPLPMKDWVHDTERHLYKADHGAYVSIQSYLCSVNYYKKSKDRHKFHMPALGFTGG